MTTTVIQSSNTLMFARRYKPSKVFALTLLICFPRSAAVKISLCYAVDGVSYKDSTARHTWNRVYYDGAWWNVDITTDNSRTANGKELYGFHKLEGAFVSDEDFFITKIY